MMKGYNGKEVSKEQFSEVELRWKAYWERYCRDYPEADAADYQDERECFMEGELGGAFKHY